MGMDEAYAAQAGVDRKVADEMETEPGLVWELLAFRDRFSTAVEALEKVLDPVLRPAEPTADRAMAAVPRLRSSVANEIEALESRLSHLQYVISRIDL